MIVPPSLKPGDRVALVAPAGPVDEAKIQTALRRCHHLGLEPVPGRAIRERVGYLAGHDEDRGADLQTAIDGDNAAIWALRGGYGTFRTLQHVDLAPLVDRPRPFIGFSDNTVIHLALLSMGVVSFHGPHAGYQHFPAATEQAFRSVLMSAGSPGRLPLPRGAQPRALVGGVAEGRLVGGNLAMLAAVCGTPYQPDTRGAILFLEDVGEPPYRVDRMLMQLRLAGLLDDLAGIALGDFSPPNDRTEGAQPPRATEGPTINDVLDELLRPLGVPVLAGLPFGHEAENWTLPLGLTARLDADGGSLEILQSTTGARPS